MVLFFVGGRDSSLFGGASSGEAGVVFPMVPEASWHRRSRRFPKHKDSRVHLSRGAPCALRLMVPPRPSSDDRGQSTDSRLIFFLRITFSTCASQLLAPPPRTYLITYCRRHRGSAQGALNLFTACVTSCHFYAHYFWSLCHPHHGDAGLCNAARRAAVYSPWAAGTCGGCERRLVPSALCVRCGRV